MSPADLSALKIDDSHRNANRGGVFRWFAIILGVLVIGTGAFFALQKKLPPVEVVSAHTSAPGQAQAATLLNASGYVTPRRRATVAAKITARVEQIYADEGMRVKAGQVLAILDQSDARVRLNSAVADRDSTQAQLSDLQVNLKNAEIELHRNEELQKSGVTTQQALDNARTTVNSYKARIVATQQSIAAAESRIKVAQQDLDNCTVVSPFDGIVVSKDAQRGEMVSPISAGGGFTRTGIATVVDMNSNEIEVDVNESYIGRVKEGQPVMATLDAYPDWQIPSHVRTIIPTADRQKATVKVRISFDKLDPRILPDMGVKVAFLEDKKADDKAASKPAMFLPKDAVHDDGGSSVVYVFKDGKAERRAVRTGGSRGDNEEILAGLTDGEQVIVRGPADLHDGQTVAIKQQ
ncbi:secretion protein HlyD [Candidatus Koribacter versatilis Ellin345]|uniref:Secretion protein HlyD n=1 Tax=Koribacter versatilis (strain Ellin345) TaxID=204669 RepID=Q1IR77_KORVE|nr:efflux RND transporter periplasmic adaptor subunit [Candidatus Koribacter versatilis]ABF40623.1 secretion protein HlyD [Candidatus Koribacter versatilis Ellin345]